MTRCNGHDSREYECDWDGAAKECARAILLDPSLALTYHRGGLLYAMQGDTDRALAASERAQQLEPLWLWPRAAAGNFLYYAKRYDEPMRPLQQVLALDDRADSPRSSLIRNFIAKGDYGRALVEIDRRPMQTLGSNAFRAQALALAGL